MALDILSAVETALATGHVEVTELLRFDFGNGIYRYLSTRQVQPFESFDGLTYEARLMGIPELGFDPTEDDSAEFEVANADNYIQAWINRGLRIQRAKVSLVRNFNTLAAPNNAVGTWTTPYWSGRVLGYELDEEMAAIEVGGPMHRLSMRALNVFGRSCWNIFAKKPWCDYDPLNGKGAPQKFRVGSATGGSATTLINTAEDFTDAGKPGGAVQVGCLALNTTDKCIGTITTVAATTLTVDDLVNGTANAFSASDEYIVGPPHTNCPRSVSACDERGQFGVNNLGSVSNRWFRGGLHRFPSRF